MHFYKLRNEFFNILSKKTLDAKYYCFDLEKTNIVKTLNNIGKVIERFKKVLLTPDVIDYDIEAKNVSKTILDLMECLEYRDLKEELFRSIFNDKENIFIDIKGIFENDKQSSLKDKYGRLKMYFDNYFKEGYKPQKNISTFHSPIDLPSDINVNKKLLEIGSTENQFWKGLPMDEVVNHFIVFMEKKSRNGKPFLTEMEFIIFLEKGFLKQADLHKQKFNYTNTEKGLIVKRFYDLFTIALTKYNEKNKKEKYIDLIYNCFDNLGERSSIEALFKPNKTKQTW